MNLVDVSPVAKPLHHPGEVSLRYLAIAFGGSLGALARYFVTSFFIHRFGNRFPYGTFIVNMSACVLIGFVLAFLNRRQELGSLWQPMVSIGFIGAYSTFSTYIWETLSSLQAGAFFTAAANVLLSTLFGLVAVWSGTLLARLVS